VQPLWNEASNSFATVENCPNTEAENPPIICVKRSDTKTTDSRHRIGFLVISSFADEKVISTKIKRGSSSHRMLPRLFIQRVYYEKQAINYDS
jgi:hypothetical protein